MAAPSVASGALAATAQDLRAAVRRLRRAPALTAAIVLTIGLGLGAAAAIWSVVEAALLEPLPYAQETRLLRLFETRTGTDERSPTSYPTLLDWRSRASGFDAVEGYDPANLTVGLGAEARMLRGARVTAGFFALLGVRMAAGRDFGQTDEAASGTAVAIVTERFARSLLGPALDRTVSINNAPYVIVGVLPAAFHFALLQDADVFMPLASGAPGAADRLQRTVNAVARLRLGVSREAALDRLAAVTADLASEHPEALEGRAVTAVRLRDALVGNMKPILENLLGAAVLLVVIIGANLALLMLTHHVERMPELAMRSALGAARERIVRLLLIESLVPALIGAGLAIAIAAAANRVLFAMIPNDVRIGMPYLADAGVGMRLVAIVVGTAALLAIAFGAVPALLVTKLRMLQRDARATATRGERRIRHGLVAAQVALTVVLLVAAALLAASFTNLVRRELGVVDAHQLVTARAPLSGLRYAEPAAQRRFYAALLARSAALPGVESAGLVNEAPGGGGGVSIFEPADLPRPPSVQPRALVRIVGGDYFATMGIPTVAGRRFDSTDRGDSPPVAVVSAAFARLLASDGANLGRRVRLGATGSREWQVVGVVGNVQAAALDADSPPVIYLSHEQAAENRMTLVLRTELPPAAVATELRSIVQTLDAGVPVYAVARLDRQLGDSRALFSRRLPMILCGVFAGAALALTLVALYATCTHEVLTRRRELAIRVALGATARSIRRLIFRRAALLAAVGIGAGVVIAALASRSMDAILFGVDGNDWRVHAAVAAVVLCATLGATLAPAVRAGSADPSAPLRQ